MVGKPALGLIQMGRSQAALKRWQMGTACSTPTPQFAPTASAPASTIASATASGVAPIMVRSLFSAGVEGEGSDDGQAGAPGRGHGQACLLDIAHGFNQQGVRARRGQRTSLRGKGRGNLLAVDLAGEQHFARGTDGGKDQRLARSAARERDAGAIDGVQIGIGDGVKDACMAMALARKVLVRMTWLPAST